MKPSTQLSRACIASAALAALAALLSQSALHATPLYWDLNGSVANVGTISSGTWDGINAFWNTDPTGTGGTPQAVSTATDDLFFSSGTNFSAASAIVISGGVVANSITIQQTGAVTLSGTGITLGGGTGPGLNFSNGTAANTISAPISLAADALITNSDNNLQTLSGGTSGAFNLTLNGNNTGGLTFSTGTINHGGLLTNAGSGTNITTISAVVDSAVLGITQNSPTSNLTISGANTAYAGTTTVTAGTLTASGAANNTFTAMGTGGITLTGGTLNLKSNGAANGSASIITGNGTTGNNVTMGSTAATINVANNGSNNYNTFVLNNLSIGTGQLNVTGANRYNLRFAGTTTLTDNATFNVTTSNLHLVGNVSESAGNFGITKLGAAATGVEVATGNLTMSGASAYTGVTSVLEGILTLNGDAPSGAAGTLGNATSAVLLGDTTGAKTAYLMANNYTIARNVTVQSGNTGIAYLGSASSSSSPGTTYSGTITLGSAGGTGHPLSVVTGAYHTTTLSGVIQDPVGLTGAGGVLTIGDVTVANSLTGSFSPNPTNGSSTVYMNGSNTYTGGTVIDTSGAVRINHAQAFGAGNLSIVRGTIQGNGTSVLAGISGQTWDGNFTLNSFTFGGQGSVNMGTSPITLTGNRIVTASNNSSTVGGVIAGVGRTLQLNGGPTNTAGLNLNGANTFDGGLIVLASASAAFTVSSGNASALGTGQVTVTNSSNSRLALNADTTVQSLTSGIFTPTFVAGTGGTNGTQALVFTGGGGTGAAGTATIVGGAITAVSITNYGQNYTSAPTIALSNPGGTGTITSNFGNSSVNLNPGTARTLTLAGTNASPATYAGIISGTNGKLVKNGPGTQILAGSNTYTGATTINGGTLKLGTGGSLASGGSVSITAGGTFDLTDPTSASGTYLWNTSSLSASGTAIAATITGTAGGMVDMGVKPIHLTFDGTHASLTVAGATLALGGNAFTVVVPGAALGAGVYTLVTAGAITGSVNPVPVFTGGNGASIDATSSVVSISGGNKVILTVTGAGFSSWIAGTFSGGAVPTEQRGPHDDPDHDGINNLIEYAISGQDPTVANANPGTFASNTLSFTKSAGTNGLTYAIVESSDLGITVPWTEVPAGPNYVNTSGTISYTLPTGTPLKNFIRLSVVSE